jgi:hypothetical protein
VERGKWIPSEKIAVVHLYLSETQEKHLAMLCVSVDQQVELVVPNLQKYITVYIIKKEVL